MERGIRVTAIVRNPGNLAIKNELLTTEKVDVKNIDQLAQVLKGHDAVISAYNAGWTNPDLYGDFLEGSRAIQEAVKRSGVKRLIVIGGGGSLFISPGVQIVDTPSFPAEWKGGASAARDYLDIIKKEKDLHWTFLSPALEMHQGTSGVRKGKYRTGLDNPVFDKNNKSIISVEDVAVAVLDETEKPKHIRQRFTVAY